MVTFFIEENASQVMYKIRCNKEKHINYIIKTNHTYYSIILNFHLMTQGWLYIQTNFQSSIQMISHKNLSNRIFFYKY